MFRIAVLVWIMLGVTLAGSFTLVVVSVPSLADQAMRLIPYAAAAGFLAAVPLSVLVARRIQAGLAGQA